MGGLFLGSDAQELSAARATVATAVELGLNFIDTAPRYGDSERVLGIALRDVASPVLISTKLGGRPEPFDPKDAQGLRASVDESRRLLGRDVIDVLMIHEPDRPFEFDWWAGPRDYRGPVLDVLEELKSKGIVRFTGLGGTTAYELARVVETGLFDVVLTAFNYSLLWREAEHEVLPAAERAGMGIVIGAPFQQGALAVVHDVTPARSGWMSAPRRRQYESLYALAREIDTPVGELALRFAISNPAVSSVLAGARSSEEVAANVAAVNKGPLAVDVLTRLDEIAAMVPYRPFDEPACLPFGDEDWSPGPMVARGTGDR